MYTSSKRLLIYMDIGILKPTGGPIGYNYYLYKELNKEGIENIEYIHSGREIIEKWKKRIDDINIGFVRNLVLILKRVYKHAKLLYGRDHNSYVELDNYDIVHFHSTLDLYNARDDVDKYKGIVVLTTHSPVLLSKEIYDSSSWFERNICSFIYNKLIRMDQYAFSRADYVIFPCEEAEEPYYHSWNKFSDYKIRNISKFRYLLTGIEELVPKEKRESVRVKYGIPSDAFLICFIGRHNHVKGYDELKKIFELASEQIDNLYCIAAGREAPLKRLKSAKWKEIGWTDDPYSVINASDVLILPNRETYFDLIMLEALALGKIIVASRTGGNKFFEKLGADSVLLYENTEQFLEKLVYVSCLSKEEKKELERHSQRMYYRYFTSKSFAQSYIDLINSLN